MEQNDQKSLSYKELKKRLQKEVARRNGYGPLNQFANSSWLYSSDPDETDEITGERMAKLINPLLYVNDLPDPFLKKNQADVFPDLRDVNNLLTRMEADPMVSTATTCRSACSGTCVANCTTGCMSCKGSCQSGCYTNCNSSCGKGCSTGCGVNCQGNCSKSCGGLCSTSCISSCANDCRLTCHGNCFGCHGTCTNACSSSCTKACIQNCGTSSRGTTTLTF